MVTYRVCIPVSSQWMVIPCPGSMSPSRRIYRWARREQKHSRPSRTCWGVGRCHRTRRTLWSLLDIWICDRLKDSRSYFLAKWMVSRAWCLLGTLEFSGRAIWRFWRGGPHASRRYIFRMGCFMWLRPSVALSGSFGPYFQIQTWTGWRTGLLRPACNSSEIWMGCSLCWWRDSLGLCLPSGCWRHFHTHSHTAYP